VLALCRWPDFFSRDIIVVDLRFPKEVVIRRLDQSRSKAIGMIPKQSGKRVDEDPFFPLLAPG
jgi:hypothetical protein